MNDIVYEEQKQLIKMWKDKYYEKKEEAERLNNIINELEKYIKENCWKDDWGVQSIYVETLLNKIQELKGSDKE